LPDRRILLLTKFDLIGVRPKLYFFAAIAKVKFGKNINEDPPEEVIVVPDFVPD